MATYEFSAESIKKMLGRVVRATDAAVRGAADAVRKLEMDDQRAEQDAAARVGGAHAESALRTGGATRTGSVAASAENVVAHVGGATRAGSAAASSAHGDGATVRSVRGGAAAARVTASAAAPTAAVPVKPAPTPASAATQVPAAAAGPVASPAASRKATTSAPAPCDLAAYVYPGSCTFEQDRLSGAARRAYQAMLDGMLAYREHIKLFGVTEAEVGEAYEAVRRGTPEAFWIDGYFLRCVSFEGRIWEVSPRYRLAREDAARMLAEMEERTRPLLDALAALPSLEQRVQAAHNALILNVGYSDTDDPFESTAAGALVEGKALCGGLRLRSSTSWIALRCPASLCAARRQARRSGTMLSCMLGIWYNWMAVGPMWT